MADFDLSREVVDRVRDASDMVEVVGEHVRLRRRGRTYEGLCPFHEEKTPSFSVDPQKGLYYCFGCHQGGDVFKFLMQAERLSFPEAVERLARRFGITLPPRTPEARRRSQEADRIRGLLEEAQQLLAEELASASGATARRELERRGFDRTTWAEFGFGWAADEWRRLTERLARRHPEGSLIAAGLTVQPQSGGSPYDRFRNRITFPIRATDGRIIGFGGRILGPGEPKYLNSPESILFHKRSTLFCLDRARAAIRASREAIVVEGYFDCLSLHRVGITNVVATLGTALTAEHARLLRRDLGAPETSDAHQPRVLLCYDADEAGRRAAIAGIQVLLEAAVDVAVIELEPGTDPDDLVRAGGVEAARELLSRPTPLIDFLVSDLPSSGTARRRAGARLAELITVAADPHARNELFMELALRLGFSPEVLRDLARRPRAQPAAPSKGAPGPLPAGEAMLVRIVLDGGDAWRRVVAREVKPELRGDPRVARLIEAVQSYEATKASEHETFFDWFRHRADDDELMTLVARVATGDAPPLTDDTIRRQLALTLTEQWRSEARQLTAQVRLAEQEGDERAVAALQERLRVLRTRRPDL